MFDLINLGGNMYTLLLGVLENSYTHFNSPSNIEKSIFYYMNSAGHFTVIITYSIKYIFYKNVLIKLIYDKDCNFSNIKGLLFFKLIILNSLLTKTCNVLPLAISFLSFSLITE